LTELVNLEKPEKHVITYGTIVTPEICQILLAKPKNKSFGGFRVIKKGEIEKIADVQTFDKTTGVTDENVIAMFPDEKEALEIAFEKIK
jgi:hypothetical protein